MKNIYNQTPIGWKRFNSLTYRILDWIILLLGLLCCVIICKITINNNPAFLAWSIVLCFYFLFYRRLVQVIFWSWDTFRFLQHHNSTEERGEKTSKCVNPDNLPMFHILIASYKACESIIPVIKAVANQDYPSDHFHAWIITEHAEQLKNTEQVKRFTQRALNFSDDNNMDESSLFLFWRCISRETHSLETWIEQLTKGSLQGYLKYPASWSMMVQDLFTFLLNVPDRSEISLIKMLHPLGLHNNEVKLIEHELRVIHNTMKTISDDFERLLGSPNIIRRDDIAFLLISKAIKKIAIKNMGKELRQRLADTQARVWFPDRDLIEKTVVRIVLSTQDIVQQTIADLPDMNIHHLDPLNRGYKPGALNTAYHHIKAQGLSADAGSTYYVIIDSDSLLPSHALKTIAQEVSCNDQTNAILQMASIPTANYFSEGWFSKFISFADAIGAVGKWARSTRRQLKPDLHAGSGVVVPATLLDFLAANVGGPWDITTLTEDARLIIGQYGMMNGVSNKTKMAPVYLLEAVPGEEGFWGTYKTFWNQRRRWTVGGYDEFYYMLRSPRWLLHSIFNFSAPGWEVSKPGVWQRLRIRIRQLHRIYLWLWDHFMWGIGGFVVLTHWLFISMLVVSPSAAIRWIGFAALITAPLIFISTSGRELSCFIPGGISKRRMCLLYLQSFFATWIYCLPVVVTQIACIFGLRGRIIEWKPTRKPRYQFNIDSKLEES